MLDALALQPTRLSLVPTQLRQLHTQSGQPWPALRSVLVGGAPCPDRWLREAHTDGWPLLTTYGLTEMASQVTTTEPQATFDQLLTAGTPLPGREVRIASTGEIMVRGDSLFRGYVDGPTCDASSIDSQGWYSTRDRGHWDERGRLVVLGRLDNLFISGGENIYPEEIECLLQEQAGVRQALVVPIAHTVYGQRPVAFVDGDLAQEPQWRQYLEDRLPRFKIPDKFFPWPPDADLKPRRPWFQERAATLLSSHS
jgi:O-succinylbenzoic acid--CoA ligase